MKLSTINLKPTNYRTLYFHLVLLLHKLSFVFNSTYSLLSNSLWNLPLCVLAPCALVPSTCFPVSRQPRGLSWSQWSAGKLGRAPRWRQCPCTAGSIGGTTPLFIPKEGGGGVRGNGAERSPCLAVGGVCRGPRPAERGQEWLYVGWGLGVQVEQVPELGAPWSQTGE